MRLAPIDFVWFKSRYDAALICLERDETTHFEPVAREVRTAGQRYTAAEFATTPPLTTEDGTVLTAGEVGAVVDGLAAGWALLVGFPKTDAETILARLTLPQGTPATRTVEVLDQFGPGGAPIEVRLIGEPFADLRQVADQLKVELASYPGVFDIQDDFRPSKIEMQLALKPEARRALVALAEPLRAEVPCWAQCGKANASFPADISATAAEVALGLG